MSTPETPSQVLRRAAGLMREQHGPEHVRHEFWLALAAWLETEADDYGDIASGPYGEAGAAFVAGDVGGDVDPAITVARAYLNETLETPGPVDPE